MIRCHTLFSGSSGNCIYIEIDGTNILVDAGVSAKQISKSLSALGKSLSDIDAVFVTHGHSDHIKGLGILAKNYRLPIYATLGAAKETYYHFFNKEEYECAYAVRERMLTVKPGYEYEVKNVFITPFLTPHDSAESAGFVIGNAENKKAIGIATDVGHINEQLVKSLCGCNTVIIESNHDVQMVKDGPYPPFLKERVLSDYGHLSNADCSKLVSFLGDNGCKTVALFHISKDNNTPELAYNSCKNCAELKKMKLLIAKRSETVTIIGE